MYIECSELVKEKVDKELIDIIKKALEDEIFNPYDFDLSTTEINIGFYEVDDSYIRMDMSDQNKNKMRYYLNGFRNEALLKESLCFIDEKIAGTPLLIFISEYEEMNLWRKR